MNILSEEQYNKLNGLSKIEYRESCEFRLKNFGESLPAYLVDVYVIVAENDTPHYLKGESYFDDKGPIVFEQYTREASLKNVRNRAERLEPEYGKCRIAKLVFIEE